MDGASIKAAIAKLTQAHADAKAQVQESNTQPKTQLFDEPETRGNQDVAKFVTNATDGKAPDGKSAANGYYTPMKDIPEGVMKMLNKAGGGSISAYPNNDGIWVQEKAAADGKPATVTFGFTNAGGERMWVRYEKQDDGNLVESKRTVDSEKYGKLSWGKEVDNSAEPHAIQAKSILAESLGIEASQLSGMKVQTLTGQDAGSFVYSANDANGNTTYVKMEPDGNGGYHETRRTYTDPSGNRTSFYNINSENVQMIKESKDGKEEKTTISQAAFKNIIGNVASNYNMASLNALTNDKEGFTTYNIKGKDGGEMWVRLNADGDVTAQTFKAPDGTRTSIYMPGDPQNEAKEVLVKHANGKETKVPTNVFTQIKNAAGKDFNIGTLTALTNDKTGYQTYEVKSDNGTRMWVRFDSQGNETARTVEDGKGGRASLYQANDTKGETTGAYLVRTDAQGKEVRVENNVLEAFKGVDKNINLMSIMPLTNDADGYHTYEAKTVDGRRIWIRFNDSNEETARTIELTPGGQRQSIYAENDNRAGTATGTEGQVTIVTGGETQTIDVDHNTDYNIVAEGTKNSNDIVRVLNGQMDVNDMDPTAALMYGEDIEAAKTALAKGDGNYETTKFTSTLLGEVTVEDWLAMIYDFGVGFTDLELDD